MYKIRYIILSLILSSALSINSFAQIDDNINNKTEYQVTEDINEEIGEELENYDAEYVHDEEIIIEKVTELKKQQIESAFSEIENIIIQNEILDVFQDWKGVRYKWGGDSKIGIDCSALVRRVYRYLFDYELPRVSVDQVKQGVKVAKADLKPGDILFFRPENRVNHTAVYIGNSLFINASSSKGVIISSLDNVYWGKYFKYGVRVNKAIEHIQNT